MKEKWLGARITAPAPGTFSTEIARARRKRVGVQRGDHAHELVGRIRFARARALVETVEVLLGARVRVDLLAHRCEIAHQHGSTSGAAQSYAREAAAPSYCARCRRVGSPATGGRGAGTLRRCGRWRGASAGARPRGPASRSATASIVMPISMPKPGAKGSTSASARACSARCPEIGARVFRPQRRRIAQRANASASPKPPPTRAAKAPTAMSAFPARDHIHQRVQLGRRVAEIPVAEDENRFDLGFARGGLRVAPGCSSRAGNRCALADGGCAAHHVRTSLTGDARGGVSGAVVGHPQWRTRERTRESGERGGDALGLVVGSDNHDGRGSQGSVGGAIYCAALSCGHWHPGGADD